MNKNFWTKWLGGAALLGVIGTGVSMLAASPDATAQTTRNSRAPQATELVGGPWLNAPGGKPVKLADLRGKVTVLHFWTFACSNCLANIPAYNRIDRNFPKKDVQVVSVHTPEFDFERKTKNVAARVKELKIRYLVLIDAKNVNWNRWNQQFWPTIYLIDKSGRVRYKHEGELQGDEAAFTRRIAELVKEPAPR